MQQIYAGLPPIEAYIALHRNYVAPMMSPVIDCALTGAEAYILWKGPTSVAATIQGVRLGKESVEQIYSYIKRLLVAAETTDNKTEDEKEIAAQFTAGIWDEYKAGTLGVDMPAAGASVSGESVRNNS